MTPPIANPFYVLLCYVDFSAPSKEDAETIAAEICSLRDFVTRLSYNKKLEAFLNEQFDRIATNSIVRSINMPKKQNNSDS